MARADVVHMTVPRRILDAVTHAKAVAYLEAHGWEFLQAVLSWHQWVSPDGTVLEIPDSDRWHDWSSRAYEAMEDLADFEGRCQLLVALDMAGMTWEEACRRGE